MWVDNDGAWVGTNYNHGTQHVWNFDNNGNLILPPGGEIRNSTGSTYATTGVSIQIDGGSPTTTFDNTELVIDGGIV